MKYLKQLAYICLLCVAGQMVSTLFGGAVPGNVLAMLILFVLLVSQRIRIGCIEETADYLLANMAILFLPATVSIFFQSETFAQNLVKLVAVCILTTVLTSLSAGFTVTYVIKLQRKRRIKRNKPTEVSK